MGLTGALAIEAAIKVPEIPIQAVDFPQLTLMVRNVRIVLPSPKLVGLHVHLFYEFPPHDAAKPHYFTRLTMTFKDRFVIYERLRHMQVASCTKILCFNRDTLPWIRLLP